MTRYNNMSREELITELLEKTSAVDELEKYRVLFNNSPEAIIFSTLEGKILDCNDCACDLYGYSRSHMLELPLWDLWTYEHVTRFPERIVDEQLNGGMNVVETHRKKCGSEFPVEVFTRLINVDGKVFRWSVVHDLKQVKKAEEPLLISEEAVHDMMVLLPELIGEPDIVLETDPDGLLYSANRMFYDKTGYTEEDVQRGFHTNQLFLPEYRKSVDETTRRILSGELSEIRERTFLRKDGATFPVMVYSTPIDDDGDITGVRIFAIDTTEHKKVEREILNMERFHALGQVSGGVMHDLNNILTIILGYTELFAQKGMKSTDGRLWGDIMEKIGQAAADGAQILKRVKNFSKAESKHLYNPLNINSIIESVLNLLVPRFQRSPEAGGPIEVVKNLSPVPLVTGNEPELKEVLSNLLINAVDAMPDGGVLTIQTTEEYNGAIVSISDTGTGMDGETKAALFRPFFTTKGEKGTGLGLYISRDIVQKLGGELLFESSEGEGTTFRLIIPAAESPAPPADSPATAQSTDPSPVAAPHYHNILVIDDEQSICDILKEYFELSEFHVDTASDGASGLAMFDRGHHDIVITDLNMPDTSGLDIARSVKKTAPDTTVIMITGSLTSFGEMTKTGMVDHVLPKPIDFQKLSELIAQLPGA